MSFARKVAHNTAIQAGGKMLGLVLSIVTAGITIRYLGEVGFGEYTTIITFLQLFGILMDFGLYIVLIKTISKIDDNTAPVVNTIFTLRIVSGVIFLGIAPFIAAYIGEFKDVYSSRVVWGIALTTLFYFFVSLNQLLSAVFQKFLRTDWIALGELVGKIVLLVATIAMVALNYGLFGILVAIVIGAGLNFLVNFWASRKYFHFRLYWDSQIVRSVLKDAWPIALSIAFSVMYFKGDTFILTFFEDEATVGVYGAPYRILEVLVTFPAMFTGLVLPVISAAWKENASEKLGNVMQRSFDAMAILTIPMIAGVIALAPFIMRILTGEGFEESVDLLKILVVATGAIYFGTLFGYIVPAIDKQKTMLYGYGFVAVSSLIGYLVLIPRYSIYGAAWMTVYSEVMVFLIALIIVVRSTKVRFNWAVSAKAVVAAVGMYALLVYTTPWLQESLGAFTVFNTRSESLLFTVLLAILVPVGALVYFGIMLAIRGISLSEIKDLAKLRS